MKVAIVAPVKYLSEYCLLTDFQMCYADIYKKSSTYKKFYLDRKEKGDIVILDYTAKLPKKVPSEREYLCVLSDLKPDYVVLPDIDFSVEKTITLAKKYLDKIDSSIQLIANLQGQNADLVYKCYNSVRDYANVIGLPCSLEKIMERDILIKDFGITKERCIFLEVYKNPRLEVSSLPNILGIVTSYPVRLGLDLRSLSEYYPTPPSLDFLSEKNPMPELVLENVYNFLEYCGASL